MKNKKKIIIFTNYYPYYKGEEYLENEIQITAQYFEKILVIPTMVTIKMEQTRDVPSNVEVLNINTDCSIKGKLKMVLKRIPEVLRNYKWAEMIRTETGISLKKILYYIYYLCRVESVYHTIVRNVRFQDFAKDDIAVLYSYWMHAVASIAARIKERKLGSSVKAITRCHGYDVYEYAAPCGFFPDRKYMMNIMNIILPCSQDGVDYLSKRYPENADKIHVQRLGTVLQSQVTCIRKPVFTFVSCSTVRSIKRLDRIINVLRLLILDGHNVKWFHIGDGPEYEKTKKLASRSLPDFAYCFVGRLQNEEVYHWYQTNRCSCFINLSDTEGVPVSIMEAMSFGIPVIATNVGGSKEIVKDGINGFMIEKIQSDEDIAKIAVNLINMSEEQYRMLCDNSYLLWQKKCNAELLFKEFYESL